MNECIGFDGYNGDISGNKMSTLGVNCGMVTGRNGVLVQTIVFGISPYGSNAMLSDNPHSGIYEAETSRTLDLNGGNPACNQGGMIVLAAIEGNGSRPSHRGPGINNGGKMFTLNGTEVHGVIVNDS